MPDSMVKKNHNMELLENLTKRLPPFPPHTEGSGPWQEYRMIRGRSKARNILNIPGKISAADWWNSEGSEFQEHGHKEREYLVVYEGEMELWVEGKEYRMKVGDSKYVAPGQRHNAYFPVATYYLAVTIPDCSDWPE